MSKVLNAALSFLLLEVSVGFAQDRNFPDEIKALASLCSTGASVDFRGEIEGGLNKMFSKLVAGSGDLQISRSETEFLESFSDENLKIEARRVYSECAIEALGIISDLKIEGGSKNKTRRQIPDILSEVRIGQKFALVVGQTVTLEGGALVSLIDKSYDDRPSVGIVSNGDTVGNVLSIGGSLHIPNFDCNVVHYSKRRFDEEGFIYSFLYSCDKL